MTVIMPPAIPPEDLPGVITPKPRQAETCPRCNGSGKVWIGKGQALLNGHQVRRGSVYPCVRCAGRGWL